jgi:hypothetical protein
MAAVMFNNFDIVFVASPNHPAYSMIDFIPPRIKTPSEMGKTECHYPVHAVGGKFGCFGFKLRITPRIYRLFVVPENTPAFFFAFRHSHILLQVR